MERIDYLDRVKSMLLDELIDEDVASLVSCHLCFQVREIVT